MPRTLMILGGGRNQLPAIQVATASGLRVVVVDPCADAIGFSHADVAVVCDLANIERCVKVAKEHHIHGALTIAADFPVPTLACICETLRLPGLTPAAAVVSTNKREMRRALKGSGIPCPQSIHVTTVSEAQDAVEKLNCPVVFKPARSSGGRGITGLGAQPPIDEIQAAFDRSNCYNSTDGVLVEEQVTGDEISVESLTFGGTTHIVAVTDKLTTNSPYFVEIGHSQPSVHSSEQLRNVETITRAALEALGIDNAAAHTEIRLTSTGPQVIEVGARLGGGFIASHLVPLSTGVDFVRAAISVAMADLPDLQRTREASAAIRFLTPPHPGFVTSVDGVDLCRNSEGVCDVDVYVRPGDEIKELIDNSRRVGHVIGRSDNVEHASRLAERVAELVTIRSTPNSARSEQLNALL